MFPDPQFSMAKNLSGNRGFTRDLRSETYEKCAPVRDVCYEWSLTEMADQKKKTTWRSYLAKGIPKCPKIVYDVGFITCMVSHFLISIGKAVPYVYTVVSMRYELKHSLD